MSEMCTELMPLSREELEDNVKQFKRGKSRYQDSRFLGMRAIGIFRLNGFRPQRLALSQQVPAALLCYE